MNRSIRQLAAPIVIIIATVFLCDPVSAQDNKLTLEEVIARHLNSIGSAQARAVPKNRVVSGTLKLITRVGTVSNVEGQAAMASSGVKLRFSLAFPLAEYPGEQFGFDGSKVLVGHLPSGKRSALSLYLDQQNAPLREGLLGGTLSSAWALLRIDQLKPKLEYRGPKKIEGRELYEIGYRPQKGSPDLKITLYFDAATFRHVRTHYEFKVPARLGNGPNDSNRFQEDYYQLVEDFDDFRAVDGLTVPYKYRIQLNVQASTGTILSDWNVAVGQVLHNQALDDQIFSR